MDNPSLGNFEESSVRQQKENKFSVPQGGITFTLKHPTNGISIGGNVSVPDGCINNASILLEPSEYFFDDDFAVPFDANLRDESLLRQQGLNEDSDEGISSSGLLAPPHSRSDSCLFTQPNSCDCERDDGGKVVRRFVPSTVPDGDKSSPRYPNTGCCPDSTSVPDTTQQLPRIHRTVSADFSTALHNINEIDKLFDNCAITFSELHQPPINATSITGSWMQAVLESSCCPRLKELLRRTAEAIDYRLAWGEIQVGIEDGTFHPHAVKSRAIGRIQRSTSHGNIFTAASLAGMKRALFNAKIAEPKTYRSIGVSTSECSGESLPDTTTATATTTWARVRSSKESLNNRKTVQCSDPTVIPSPPKNMHSGSVNTWRAVKEVAGRELTTWGQLRRTASLGTRKTHKAAYSRKDNLCSNMHTSLMLSDLNNTFRPVSQKAMHRYSGTLLEIFMRARAKDLVSSSSPSSTGTNTTTEEVPHVIKRPGLMDCYVSTNTSLKANGLSSSLGTGNEHRDVLADRSSGAFLKMGVPSPKISQPPRVPVRKSSVNSRRLLPVNCSGGACFAPRNTSELPNYNLLTMSADPESECLSRLRETSSFSHLRNPRAAIVYPGLGKLAIPKPSRIESNTFLSQTLPDLSLLGKAAAQEAKSGAPMTRIPNVSHGSRRAASVVPVSERTTGVAMVTGHKSFVNHRINEIEAIRQRMTGFNVHRASDIVNESRLLEVLGKKSQSQVVLMHLFFF